MTQSNGHAEILARIAKEVVEQHRARLFTTGQGQTTTDPDVGNVPVPTDPSWSYTLPERWRS